MAAPPPGATAAPAPPGCTPGRTPEVAPRPAGAADVVADPVADPESVEDRARLFLSLVRECTDLPLRVTGRFPAWLGGTLVRNGPALFELPRQSLRHWFDGQAMLHAFALADGQVRYTNRFVRGRAWHANAQAGRLRYREFATDPCHALFARVRALFDPTGPGGVTDNACIGVARLGRWYAALTEGALPIAFDPTTLQAAGVVDWAGAPARPGAAGPRLTTAHPHARADGTLVNFSVRFGRRCAYEVFVADPRRGTRTTVATFHTPAPAYVHSIGLTATCVVLAECSWTIDPLDVVLSGRSFAENYRWRTGHPTRLHLVDLAGRRRTVTCEVPPFFTFHHVNAFDDGDAVVCDLVAYPDATVVDALYLDRLRDPAVRIPGGTVQRWRIPRQGGAAECVGSHANAPLELPRVHPARDGVRYRHVYGAGASAAGHFLDRVVKLDVDDGTVQCWSAERCYPGEPVFVPAPGARAEDDGVVLTLVLDGAAGTSALVALDGRTLEEVARAEAPHAIPAGFHGEFFDRAPALAPADAPTRAPADAASGGPR